MHTEQQLQADDGARIAARRYESIGTPQATLVIGCAMGVRQGFYAPFAQWAAQQGYRVWTFDYRGSGDSLAGRPLRGFEADLDDWARDYDAVIAEARAAAPSQPLYLLGHSLGAQLPGLLRRPELVDGLVCVAAGSGYWRENAPRLKRTILYFWFVLVPLAVRLFGYFPGRRLRKVGDLPRGVMLQWRRWCLNPRYSVGAEGERAERSYARVRFPVLALSVADDEMMTLRGTHSLVSLYTAAPRAVERIEPAEAELPRIGHFGFFREQAGPRLWPRLVESLRRLPALADVPHTTA